MNPQIMEQVNSGIPQLSRLYSYDSSNLAEAALPLKQKEERDDDDDDMFADFFDFNNDMLVDSIDELSISGPISAKNSKNQTAAATHHSDEDQPLALPSSDSNGQVDYDQLWKQAGDITRKAFENFNDDNNANPPDIEGQHHNSSSNALSLYKRNPLALSNDCTNQGGDSKESSDETFLAKLRSPSLTEWIKNNVEIVHAP